LPEGLQVSGDYSFYSKYVWRGFVLDEDPVLQPGIYLSYKGLNLGLWSSMDMSNAEGAQSDEIDYSVDYTFYVTSEGSQKITSEAKLVEIKERLKRTWYISISRIEYEYHKNI
jgi:hypothetical protein